MKAIVPNNPRRNATTLRNAGVLAILATNMALGNRTKLPSQLPSRTNCADCHAVIPPGRPGRRCESCRSKVTPDPSSTPTAADLPHYGEATENRSRGE